MTKIAFALALIALGLAPLYAQAPPMPAPAAGEETADGEQPEQPEDPRAIADMPEWDETEPEQVETFEKRHDNGMLVVQFQYYTDQYGRKVKHGTYTEWYPGTDQKKRESEYRHGRLHGSQRWWYSNGRTWMQFKCKQGKRDGNLMEYRRNGRLKRQVTYVDGKPMERKTFKLTGQD